MNDTFCIFFTSAKTKDIMQVLSHYGVMNPLADYRFSVKYTSTGKISIRTAVRAYGYMVYEDEAMKLKAAGWGGLNPTAMIRVEEQHLPQMVKMIAADGKPDLDFISSRLVPV